MLEKAVGGLTDGLRTLKYCGDATFLNFVLIVPESLFGTCNAQQAIKYNSEQKYGHVANHDAADFSRTSDIHVHFVDKIQTQKHVAAFSLI